MMDPGTLANARQSGYPTQGGPQPPQQHHSAAAVAAAVIAQQQEQQQHQGMLWLPAAIQQRQVQWAPHGGSSGAVAHPPQRGQGVMLPLMAGRALTAGGHPAASAANMGAQPGVLGPPALYAVLRCSLRPLQATVCLLPRVPRPTRALQPACLQKATVSLRAALHSSPEP